mgnify:CR=1 FL=1
MCGRPSGFCAGMAIWPAGHFLAPAIRNRSRISALLSEITRRCLQRGDSALASILRSLAHELTHYFQWVRDPVGYQTADESRLERQADRCARETLYDYADVYAHP